jgi:hypothetical protein
MYFITTKYISIVNQSLSLFITFSFSLHSSYFSIDLEATSFVPFPSFLRFILPWVSTLSLSLSSSSSLPLGQTFLCRRSTVCLFTQGYMLSIFRSNKLTPQKRYWQLVLRQTSKVTQELQSTHCVDIAYTYTREREIEREIEREREKERKKEVFKLRAASAVWLVPRERYGRKVQEETMQRVKLEKNYHLTNYVQLQGSFFLFFSPFFCSKKKREIKKRYTT